MDSHGYSPTTISGDGATGRPISAAAGYAGTNDAGDHAPVLTFHLLLLAFPKTEISETKLVEELF